MNLIRMLRSIAFAAVALIATAAVPSLRARAAGPASVHPESCQKGFNCCGNCTCSICCGTHGSDCACVTCPPG